MSKETTFKINVEPIITDPDTDQDIFYAVGGSALKPIYNFQKYVVPG